MSNPISGRQPTAQEQCTGYRATSRRLIRPIVKLIYAHHFDNARELLAKNRTTILESDFAEDVREALGYDLMLCTYHLDWHPDVNGWTRECYLKAMDRFAPAAGTELGEYVRRRWVIKIKLHATLDGLGSA